MFEFGRVFREACIPSHLSTAFLLTVIQRLKILLYGTVGIFYTISTFFVQDGVGSKYADNTAVTSVNKGLEPANNRGSDLAC